MIKQTTSFSLATMALLFSNATLSADARTLGMGGSAIANGFGVYGAAQNPASLMTQQRADYGLHLHGGGLVDLRDDSGLLDELLDNEDLARDIEDQIEALSGQSLSCNQSPPSPNDVCLSDTEQVGQLADDVLGILNRAEGNSISGGAGFDFGIGMTKTQTPFSVHLSSRLVASFTPVVNPSDKDYLQQIADSLADGELTAGEIANNGAFSIAPDGNLEVQQPEDVLQSEVDSVALLRSQVSVSMARTIEVSGIALDFGITPKISSLIAASVNTSIADDFNDDEESLNDQFEDSESSGVSFTVDIGMALPLDQSPVAFAAVLRNAIPEVLKTESGTKVETTPQLVVGTAYALGRATFSADLALNSAKIDNIKTQPLALGVEVDANFLKLRAGLSHDTQRGDQSSALNLGIGLGPLQLGARLSGDNITSFSSYVSAQLAYSF